MRFCATTILALSSVVGIDAFVNGPTTWGKTTTTTTTTIATATTRRQMVGSWDNDNFLEGLSNSEDSSDKKGEEDDEVSSGSSKFEAMMKAAESKGGGTGGSRPVSIDNPYLNIPSQSQPSTSTPPATSELDDLSVEDQARMFRVMMQQQQQGQGTAAQGGPAEKVARTDRAGRPVGRNRDADAIANAADVYFAQLKRDSTVRTLARIRGEDEIAESVFEDEAIEEIGNLLQTNPYLQRKKDEDMKLIEDVPEDIMRAYLEGETMSEEEKATSGVSYKEMLQKRRAGGGATRSQPPQQQQVVSQPPPPPPAPETPPPPVPQLEVAPQAPAQVAASMSPLPPPPVTSTPPPPQPPPAAVTPEPAMPQPVMTTSASASASTESSPEEVRQQIRTLMGLIIKHRGGPGFGSGRLKGPDIDRFESLLEEVGALLRSEAAAEGATQPPPAAITPPAAAVAAVAPEVPVPPAVPATPAPADPAPAAPVGVDSAIACIEGAITMYRNVPPELQGTVLVTLRAALQSAVSACNAVIADNGGDYAQASTMGQMESAIACIEGATTMYKNSPPGLQGSILITLRSALMSAVNTCDSLMGNTQQAPPPSPPVAATAAVPPPPPPPPPAAQIQAPPPPSPPVVEVEPNTLMSNSIDANSKQLQDIYMKIKSAAGDGSLGLRSDLGSDDASELADNLIEMRDLLMAELDAGIPDPGSEATLSKSSVSQPSPPPPSSSSSGDSTMSLYQQMLAKAKAEKAAN